MKKVKNKLRVIHFPQVPCKPFIVNVKDEEEAHKISEVLAEQHLWLLEQNIIPDYSNAICVEMFDETAEVEKDEDQWCDYWNEAELMEFDEFVETYITKK